jgi:SAM-dependent methyltransferase
MQSKELFEKYKAGQHWNFHSTEYAERFADFLIKNNFNGLLVDIGCGKGRDVKVFMKKGLDALGVDISQEIIDTAQSYCRECKFARQDAEDLEFSNEEVAAFYMINVIHYLDEERVLPGIYRSLVPGGYLFIHFNLSIVDEDSQVDYSRNEAEILRLVEKFKILEKREFTREDKEPKKHTHKILELILQK